jgi:eukaryotic-like serine/threonine-protein kinase
VNPIPALGGESRLIAKGGHDPQFSPDGSRIAYWTGAGVSVSITSQIYTIPSTGGVPRDGQSEVNYARHPIWTADGKHLLFWGLSEQGADWWVVELDTGSGSGSAKKNVPTGVQVTFSRTLGGLIYPGCWLEEHVIYPAQFGDTTDLWSIPIARRNWRATAKPSRLTTGLELVQHPSASGNRHLVFASLHADVNIWSFAVDGNSGKVTGELEKLTDGIALKDRPVLARGGRKLAFGITGSRQDTDGSIVVKDLTTGKETRLATPGSLYPSLNRDGSKLAYAQLSKDRGFAIYVVASSGGMPEWVCDDCGLTPTAWSNDDGKLLYDFGVPQAVGLLDLTSRKKTELLKLPDRDGFRCIWAQRVDPESKQPVKTPFAVAHSHQARRSLTNVGGIGLVGLGVSRDRLVFNLGELTGNAWTAQFAGPN